MSHSDFPIRSLKFTWRSDIVGAFSFPFDLTMPEKDNVRFSGIVNINFVGNSAEIFQNAPFFMISISALQIGGTHVQANVVKMPGRVDYYLQLPNRFAISVGSSLQLREWRGTSQTTSRALVGSGRERNWQSNSSTSQPSISRRASRRRTHST